MGPEGEIVGVSVGRVRKFRWQGRTLRSAIWKAPVGGPVRVTADGVDGDEQAAYGIHGDAHKAVYAYGAGDLAWWSAELGRELAPGTFGENLTVAGLDVSAAVVGERWTAGSAELEVTGPRVPCVKLGARMGDTGFPRRFAAAGRPGAYLLVRTGGTVTAGDQVRVTYRPSHGLSVADVNRIYHVERDRSGELIDLEGLDPDWTDWARKRAKPGVPQA